MLKRGQYALQHLSSMSIYIPYISNHMTETKHKVGIIGAGVIADFHAQALQAIQSVELVAAYARNQDKADSFSQNYGCSGYSDLDEFLKHPGMDVVTIGSVSGVHLEHATAAAQAGKHIIARSHWKLPQSGLMR